MTQNRTHASEHESGTFSGGHTAQTLCLPSKLAYKRQILEMSTSPRMNPIVWNFAVCAACCVIAPTQNVQYFVFLVPDKGPLNECVCLSFFLGGGMRNQCAEMWKLHCCTHQLLNSHLFFQKWSKSVLQRGQKAMFLRSQKTKTTF